MGKNIKVVVLDVENSIAEVRVIEDSLDSFRKNLNCEWIEMPERRIGKKYFNIVSDEEALLNGHAKISAINNMGEPMLCWNLIFTGMPDDEGNLTSLTDEECNYILSRIQNMSTRMFPEGYLMLTQCEY